MQNIRSWSVTFAVSCILFACSSNSSTSAGNGGTTSATSDNSGGGSSNGYGSFAYTIDGNKVAVKSLYINEVKNSADGRLKIEVTNTPTSEVFKFLVAHVGTTTILHFRPSFTETKNQATYMSHKYKNYYGDSVIVTITGNDASHVAGTFSGKYLSDDNSPIEISEGSFDLPIVKN